MASSCFNPVRIRCKVAVQRSGHCGLLEKMSTEKNETNRVCQSKKSVVQKHHRTYSLPPVRETRSSLDCFFFFLCKVGCKWMREPNNVKTAGHMGRMKLMMRSLVYIMLKMRCVSVSEGWKRYNASNLLARCISFPFFFWMGTGCALKKHKKTK